MSKFCTYGHSGMLELDTAHIIIGWICETCDSYYLEQLMCAVARVTPYCFILSAHDVRIVFILYYYGVIFCCPDYLFLREMMAGFLVKLYAWC